MQAFENAVASLVCNLASLLAIPAILLLLLRKMAPAIGDPLWHGYCQLLRWMVVAPFRLIRTMFREATRRRR